MGLKLIITFTLLGHYVYQYIGRISEKSIYVKFQLSSYLIV